MMNEQKRKLCLDLMHADSAEEVISILKAVGYWEDKGVWRLYGDRENNFSTIGNQQNRADAALVEKIVNAVDARLMNACLARKINPESQKAPQTIREAVAMFFDETAAQKSSMAGLMRTWSAQKRTEVARGVTLAATGLKGQEGDMSITISDAGEGQTPRMFPDTFLSIDKSNKLRIPFVQGKFNMGGTGVLEFCGKHNLQLIVSRRNPAILGGKLDDPADDQWGFTIIRREDPEGNRRSSSYTYLAPVGADHGPNHGEVLSFRDSLPIFPEGTKAYAKHSTYGTLIKLYEYSLPGHRTHILRKSGLLARLELLLPDVALPVRLHECRAGYGGHAGSFETTLTGIGVRLDDDKAENLESDFPVSAPLACAGENMTATIYAFKKGRAETYRKSEGIIFTVNGQTHGYLTVDFFRRKTVGLSYLADSVLVVVDCTKISRRGIETLFMNNRCHLRDGDLKKELDQELEDLLRNQAGLRALRERRRREEIESRIEDSKPLEQILETLLKQSPTLSQLFLLGKRAANPFKTKKAAEEEKPFDGKKHPTYFKFKGKEYGFHYQREAHINMRCRIAFETDAVNDYLSRSVDPGEFALFALVDGTRTPVQNYTLNLQNGIATLSLKLPEGSRIGDRLTFLSVVTDSTRLEPFENKLTITVKEAAEPTGKPGGRRKPPGQDEGDDREIPSGIQLPVWTRVPEADWNKHTPPFDQYTAVRIKHAGSTGEGEEANGKDVYDFFINVDNLHLKRFLKYEVKAGEEDRVARTRFEIGMVLVGLSIIHHSARERKNTTDTSDEQKPEINVEDQVEGATKALAPFLLPMIDALGSLNEEQTVAAVASGEAT